MPANDVHNNGAPTSVGIGVIGCGHWGPNHVRVFAALAQSQVHAVADRDADRLAAVGAQHPGLDLRSDHTELLDDSRIDAVVICTPTATHHAIVRDAIEAGKHVLCEKPLCLTTAEAAELVELARERERVLMVGNVFLFNPGIEKLRELTAEDDFGEPRYLSAIRTNLGPIRHDVDVAYDLAAHDLSIFNWLLGAEPESVSATGAAFLREDVADVAFISLRYPGDVLAVSEVSWLNPKKERRLTVVGSRQMLTWDDMEPGTPVSVYDKGAATEPDYNDFGEYLRLSMWDGEVRLPKVHVGEPLKAQDSKFLEYVQAGQVERSDAEFSLGIVRALEAAGESMRNGGTPVALSEVGDHVG